MPAFDVTIQGKTYHVEIPNPGASPLQVVVDGQPFDVGIVGTEIEATPAKLAPAPRPAAEPAQLPPPPRHRGNAPGRGIRRASRQRNHRAHARHDPVD